MKKQDYSNYKRYYAPHHFVFLPLMGFLLVLGMIKSFTDPVHKLEWLLFSVLSFCILYLVLMLRQHYALTNQNRIVRLEFRLRHFELLGTRSAEIEKSLSFSQIAALRFADDQQFITLLDRAVHEKLTAEEIKRSITNWQADNMRV